MPVRNSNVVSKEHYSGQPCFQVVSAALKAENAAFENVSTILHQAIIPCVVDHIEFNWDSVSLSGNAALEFVILPARITMDSYVTNPSAAIAAGAKTLCVDAAGARAVLEVDGTPALTTVDLSLIAESGRKMAVGDRLVCFQYNLETDTAGSGSGVDAGLGWEGGSAAALIRYWPIT